MLSFNRPHFLFGPLRWDGRRVVHCNKRIDGVPELVYGGETGPAQRLPRRQAEPDFHLVEPRCVGGGEVPMHLPMLAQPEVLLRFMSIKVVHNRMQLAQGVGRHHFVHEGQKVPAATALKMSRLHLPAGHLQGRKECRGIMPFVLVIKPHEGPAVGWPQPALRPLQSLNMGLPIDA